MCSSPPSTTEPPSRKDVADRVGSAAGWLALAVAVGWLAACLHGRLLAPPPGEVVLEQETHLQIALAPMPVMESPPPEPVVEPEPLPEPEPEPVVEPVLVPESPRLPPMEPEPLPEPEVAPPPVEAALTPAVQPAVEKQGAAGREEAIQAEWLGELSNRIEQSKFYPGAARYSRETGTVLLLVEVEPTATIGSVRILENSGSALLAEAALAILKRAAAKPLGTNTLPSSFQVEVPITYQVGRR